MPLGITYLSACLDIFFISFRLQPVTLKDSTVEPPVLLRSLFDILGAIAALKRRIMERGTSKVVRSKGDLTATYRILPMPPSVSCEVGCGGKNM